MGLQFKCFIIMSQKRKVTPVYLKFYRNQKENKIVGFVRKRNGSWIGCHEDDDEKKKIVLIGNQVKNVMENILYKANLIPMKSDQGFVCIGVRPVQFDAEMEVIPHLKGNGYSVKITFGNRKMVYDEKNDNPMSSNLQSFIDRLSHRIDIKNINKLVDEFIRVVSINSYRTTK